MADTYTASHAATLLDKLSSDDQFRTQFQNDPASALKSLGLPGHLAECCKGKTLASKEQLAASRDAITGLLTQKLALNVHNLHVAGSKN